MKKYLISNTHFNHKNIIDGKCVLVILGVYSVDKEL